MRRFSQKNALVTLSDINVTPLLDLAFVLLIIFVITTPLLEQSVQLELPSPTTSASNAKTSKRSKSPRLASLSSKPTTSPSIGGALFAEFQKNPKMVVDIRADGRTRLKSSIDASGGVSPASSMIAHVGLGALLFIATAGGKPNASSNEAPPLEMIAGELVDAALAPGFLPQPTPETPPTRQPEADIVKDTPPPKVSPPSEPQPEPETPTPPAKAPPPEIRFDLPKAREPGFTLPSSQVEEKPKDKPKRPEREAVKIDLSKIKAVKPPPTPHKDRAKATPSSEPPGPSDEELARQRRQDLARSLEGATGKISGTVSRGAVQVQIGPLGGGGGGGGGTGGGGSAYAWHVRNAFNNAWIPPQNVKDEFATADVEVVIRKDGRVTQARIIKRSGIASLDRSVQEALDRVREVVPFEAGATEDTRTYTIGFNLRSKRTF
jgi:TonB family protein